MQQSYLLFLQCQGDTDITQLANAMRAKDIVVKTDKTQRKDVWGKIRIGHQKTEPKNYARLR